MKTNSYHYVNGVKKDVEGELSFENISFPP
jgi:hypothetical protein